MPLPEFEPPSKSEMRALWRQYPDPQVRRLVLEILYLRDLLAEIDRTRSTIDKVWKADVGGNLVALEQLRYRLAREKGRRL